MANDYLDNLQRELEMEGIVPSSPSVVQKVNMVDDNELRHILRMEQVTGVKYSDEQRALLEHHGNACILACAGSGKTTVSTHLIAKRILTGEIKDVNKLIYTTYSKAGKVEMKERLDKLLKQLDIHVDVEVRTLHSFFLQVIRIFGVSSNIIKASTRSQYIKEACKEAEFLPKDDELMIIDNLLSYQVNNLLGDRKTIESPVNTLENLSVDQYTKIRVGYANRKAKNNLIDYDDMQSLLYLWLVKYAKSNKPEEVQIAESVRNYCKAMWTDFYIDEAQDVSKIQFAIIRAMVTDPNDKNKLTANLVFIGDDDQCIYVWRGSDPSIILTIGATFNMPVFKLTTNYRCLSEIVDYATTGIKCNGSRFDKGMQASNKGGSVKIYPLEKNDLCTYSNAAMNHIKWWLKQGNRPSDIAVLSRNNFHLALLNSMLLREGIYCNITDDMKITKSPVYQDIKTLIDICVPCWRHDLTQKVLWKLCRYMGAGNAKVIADFQNASALSLADTLGYLVKNYINRNIDYDKKLNIPLEAEQRIKYYMETKLSSDTKNDMYLIYQAVTCESKEQALRALMFQYIQATSFLYKTKDSKRSVEGLTAYISMLLTQDGYEKMTEFLRVTEQLENGSMVIPGEKITLTTVHSAKGREWKNVIMFAADNIAEPSFDGMYKMLDDDISVHDIFQHLNEERRLFYVGNTRAKENLVTLTSKEPSVFILEALGIIKNKQCGTNDIILECVNDSGWYEKYREATQSIILDKNNKYFYDINDYALN